MTTTRQPVPALAPVAFLEGKEGHRMKPTRFPRELRLSIPRTCGTEVWHAAARRPWLTGALTCDSGSRAARSGFCQWPSGTPRASSSRPWSFFLSSAVPDRRAQLRDQACLTENPNAETYAGIGVRQVYPVRPLVPCRQRLALADFRSSLASAEASLDSPKRCFSFSSLERPDCSPSHSAAGLCLRTCESNTRQVFGTPPNCAAFRTRHIMTRQ